MSNFFTLIQRFSTLAVTMGVLVGCERLSLEDFSMQSVPLVGGIVYDEANDLVCPHVLVIEQAASHTRFAGNAVGDVNAAEYTLRFGSLRGECRLDSDGRFIMDIVMDFVAIPGAAMPAQSQAEAEWFLVLTRNRSGNESPQLMARQTFRQNVVLRRDRGRVALQESYSVTVDDIAESDVGRLSLYAGYVVNDSEWKFHEDNPFFFR